MTKKNKLKKDPLLEIAQLRESEDRWRTLAENSPDHILTLAPDLTIEYVNHPSPGLTIEELIGKPITSFLLEDKQTEVKVILQGVIDTGQAALYETEYPTPDGGMIYYETHVMPRESAGKMIGLMLNSRDCSKRKRIELKLQESEKKYRALYENAPLPYQSLDEEGRFLDVNPAWLRTLGYKRDQVIGENFADFLRPDSKPHFVINFPAFKERGYVSDVQFKIRHKDGHHLDISFEGCIGYNPGGEFLQTYCVFQDITERLRSLEEVRLQENRIQSIFRSAPIGIGLVINRTMKEVNEELCKIVGYSNDELINQNARMLYPTQADFDFVGKEKYSQISKSGTGSVETRLLRKNGEVIDVIVSSTPVDVNDQGLGVTFTVMDISERKKAELALQANKNLLNATQQLTKAGGWKWNVENQSMLWTDETYRIHDIDPND